MEISGLPTVPSVKCVWGLGSVRALESRPGGSRPTTVRDLRNPTCVQFPVPGEAWGSVWGHTKDLSRHFFRCVPCDPLRQDFRCVKIGGPLGRYPASLLL